MPLLNIDNGRDAAQALGQVGPRIAQGQYRGTQLGQQRARDEGHFAMEQQNQQRMLQELQLRIQQAKAENEFRIQQFQQRSDAQQETAGYHSNMLGVAKERLEQGGNKFKNKQQGKFDKNGQFLGTEVWDENGNYSFKPQGNGSPNLGQGGPGMNKFSPVAAINAFNPVVDYGNQHPGLINSNPTNTAYNPGFASQYSMGTNVQAQMAKMLLQQAGQPSGPVIGQMGQTNPPPPQIPGQAAPSVPRFRYDPASGQLSPAQ